jgi:hypothetical protein
MVVSCDSLSLSPYVTVIAECRSPYVAHPMVGQVLGVGDFCMDPHPLCGYMLLLLNCGTLDSVPLSRVLDVERLTSSVAAVLDGSAGEGG